MIGFSFKQKILVGSICTALLVLGGAGIVLYQPASKTEEIYAQAIEDYKKGDYSNSYYLFSKVTFFSNLKPVAIYHQGQAAHELGDENAAVKQYQLLFNNYPRHALSLKAKYLTAQSIVFKNPKLAHKYFEEIVNKYPHTDYGIASEYYLGVLIINKYHDNEDMFPLSEKINAENYFRHYLTKAPTGRLAINACENWLGLKMDINQDDYLLMAKSYYLFGDYKKAQELLAKTQLAESWTTDVLVSHALKNYARAKYLTEYGLKNYSQYVTDEDLHAVIDKYLDSSNQNTLTEVMNLIALNPQKGNDYLLNIKCRQVKTADQPACYSNLYIKYPDGQFSADALSNIFFEKYKQNKLKDAEKIGMDYLKKFPDANSTPKVMFWMGKLYERTNNYQQYNNYYSNVISKFPDTYYAYRAYLHLKHLNSPIITNYITPQPVTYPYKYTRKNIIVKLVELKDFDIIGELCNDDDFIKSWVAYKKGDHAHSMLIARDAMEKIKDKPDRFDLRWRLVYPVNYYETIEKYSNYAGVSMPLMLSIIREESYFDPLAQSAVGAGGLMQLMPLTAREISSKYGLGMTNYDDLFNPEMNIKLGNYYFAFLKSMLEGKDISSVAAYNGGIGSIKRWQQSINYNDTDEFVEQIPYEETRNYVKKVFRTYWNYIRLYT